MHAVFSERDISVQFKVERFGNYTILRHHIQDGLTSQYKFMRTTCTTQRDALGFHKYIRSSETVSIVTDRSLEKVSLHSDADSLHECKLENG